MIELIPQTAATTLDLPELFGRIAPVHVDLGCGDGSFLRALAAENPQRNYLGIERLLHRVRSCHRKTAGLPNVRVIRSETMFVLRHLLAQKSVAAFYLLFPDPWPKRRHHRRRLITSDFLEVMRKCLTDGGSLFIATDHDEYFAAIHQVLSKSAGYVVMRSRWTLPPSTFEKSFAAGGMPIHRLEVRKASPVR